MAYSKSSGYETMNKGRFLLLLYFILFPFGQLLRIETHFFAIPITLHVLDIVVGLCALYVFYLKQKMHPVAKWFLYFWLASTFSLLISVAYYPLEEVARGSLYLFRFISYYFLFELVLLQNKKFVLHLLVAALTLTAIFGWIQYVMVPDLRFLKYFNWDDHLNRLTGTILDPGFMGIIMVVGCLIASAHYWKTKHISLLFLVLFFFITCLFTYSRASYIALLSGMGVLLYLHRKYKTFFVGLVLLFGLLFLLPKGQGEGVNLLRTNSIFQKLENYQETIFIASEFPVFGVGFNTLCSERIRILKDSGFMSHSCSGSDSSILFLLATTGVVGLLTFIRILFSVPEYLSKSTYTHMLTSCSAAIFVHSLFLNSLFYPWILGVLFVLLALSLKKAKLIMEHR